MIEIPTNDPIVIPTIIPILTIVLMEESNVQAFYPVTGEE
jgi:hypothetical protein